MSTTNPPRRFGPRPANAFQQTCPGCRQPLREGDYTTPIAVGPGADPEERAKARTGSAYNAVAIEAHYACVTGQEETTHV